MTPPAAVNARCSSAAAWGFPRSMALRGGCARRARPVSAALGFHSAADVFLADELRALGVNVHIATDDGSAGLRGLVTDAMDAAGDGYTHLYTCGPEPDAPRRIRQVPHGRPVQL